MATTFVTRQQVREFVAQIGMDQIVMYCAMRIVSLVNTFVIEKQEKRYVIPTGTDKIAGYFAKCKQTIIIHATVTQGRGFVILNGLGKSENYLCNNTTGERICKNDLFGVNCSESREKSSKGSSNYLKIFIGVGAILVVGIIIAITFVMKR